MRQLPHHDSLSLPACGFGGLFGHTRSAMRLKYFPVAVMVNYVKSLRTIPSATCSNSCCDKGFSCPKYEYVDTKESSFELTGSGFEVMAYSDTVGTELELVTSVVCSELRE